MGDDVSTRDPDCSPGDCKNGKHSIVLICARPWRMLFLRRRWSLLCWHCDLEVREPHWMRKLHPPDPPERQYMGRRTRHD